MGGVGYLGSEDATPNRGPLLGGLVAAGVFIALLVFIFSSTGAGTGDPLSKIPASEAQWAAKTNGMPSPLDRAPAPIVTSLRNSLPSGPAVRLAANQPPTRGAQAAVQGAASSFDARSLGTNSLALPDGFQAQTFFVESADVRLVRDAGGALRCIAAIVIVNQSDEPLHGLELWLQIGSSRYAFRPYEGLLDEPRFLAAPTVPAQSSLTLQAMVDDLTADFSARGVRKVVVEARLNGKTIRTELSLQ
jgi:hypothetical protein